VPVTRPTRIGIIGLGMAAEPHAQALRAMGDAVEVVAAFSPTAARRTAFAQRHAMPVVDRAEAIFEDRSIGLVLLLTPPNTHLELVTAAADAGKNIILEKPLDVSLERAQAIVEICAQRRVALGVVFQNRYRPASRALFDLLAQGRLGRLISATARVDNWRPQGYYDEPGRGTVWRDGGGVLLTQAIHTIDLLLAATGLPDEVFGYTATSPVHVMETEDVAAAVLHFPGGAMGTLNATTAAYPGRPERLDFVGERGTAQLSGGELVAQFHDGSSLAAGAPAVAAGGVIPVMASGYDLYKALLEDFLRAIDEGRPVPVGGTQALAAHRLVEAIVRSSSERRMVRLAPRR
jgi:predicted dehydrogenase